MALGNYFGALRAFANVSASVTDQVLVVATPGKVIRVIAMYAFAQGATTQLTLNTYDETSSGWSSSSTASGSGATYSSTAISPIMQVAANGGGLVLNECDPGWFETDPGGGLSVSTGTGSTIGILVVYVVVNP